MRAVSSRAHNGDGAHKSVIMVVDDHPVVRRGLADLIRDDHDLAIGGEAATGEEALEIIDRVRPDLVLVDISLPDMTGIELMRRLKKLKHPPRILVVSMYDESLYADRAIQAGAMGYINKAESPESLVDAIRTVLLDTVYISAAIAERALQRRPRGRSRVGTFSERELEVFELIGQGLSTQQIARQLALSPKTIDTYREHLKHKLKVANSAELVRHAVQWVLENQ